MYFVFDWINLEMISLIKSRSARETTAIAALKRGVETRPRAAFRHRAISAGE